MHQQIERTGHRQMIGGPTVQHVEISYALLDETNHLDIHDCAVISGPQLTEGDQPQDGQRPCGYLSHHPPLKIGDCCLMATGGPVRNFVPFFLCDHWNYKELCSISWLDCPT